MKTQRLLILGTFLLLFPLIGAGQSLQLADSLFQKGKEYDRSGKMEQSEFYYREAYNIYRDFQDTASWLEAGKEYASTMMFRAKNEKAMELYKKLLKVNHPANDAYNRGDLYNSMGLLSKRTGKLEQARRYYMQSLPLAEESGDSLLIGVVHSNLGSIYSTRGDYAVAMEREQKALGYFKGLNRKRNIAITLNNIGNIYQELSIYDKALQYYTQSLEIRKELGDIRLLANNYSNIGHVQRELGNYDQALVSYQKSLELGREAQTPNLTLTTLNNIGVLYKTLGEYEKALDYYQQSYVISEEISEPRSMATTSKNLGKLLWEMGNIEEAEDHYRKALKLRRKIANPYDIASSLNTMTDLALENGKYDQALQYARQIEAIGDSTDSYDILQDAERYYGKIHRQQGNNAPALEYFKKEYAYSQYLPPAKQLGPLQRLAEQYHKMNSDSAIVYGEKAIDIIEEHRSNAGASSELKSGYLGRHTDFYTQVASWILTYSQDLSRAYTLVEQAKARSLSDELAQASQNIDQQLPEDIRIERNKRRNRIDSLYSSLERTANDKKRNQIQKKIREAELNYSAYENKLHTQYPELKSLQSPEPITLNRAQALTDRQTAVLEYAVAGDQLIIFLISKDMVRAEQSSLSSDNEPLHEKLTSWVADFKGAILANAARAELRNQSNTLYNALLKPFEDELTGFSNLIIVPDGALAYLPFEAISQGDQYLIENFNIKYVPSLTSLTLLQKTNAPNRQDLLAIAGSQFSDNNNRNRSIRKSSLSALPSTSMEVDSIASQFQRSTTLKNGEISEQKFKEMLQNNSYRYLHLATHGIIDENYPSRSGLALSTEGELSASSQEDGMLRSSEIFGLNIECDMVVLSACNTGLGKVVKGEGMLGMQRAFFYAGASTVVVSLWNVYDRSTASFMNEFYKSLNNHTTEESWTDSILRWIGWDQSLPFGEKALAMREAKLQMIKHPLFNHPVYWAPFVVVGR